MQNTVAFHVLRWFLQCTPLFATLHQIFCFRDEAIFEAVFRDCNVFPKLLDFCFKSSKIVNVWLVLRFSVNNYIGKPTLAFVIAVNQF